MDLPPPLWWVGRHPRGGSAEPGVLADPGCAQDESGSRAGCVSIADPREPCCGLSAAMPRRCAPRCREPVAQRVDHGPLVSTRTGQAPRAGEQDPQRRIAAAGKRGEVSDVLGDHPAALPGRPVGEVWVRGSSQHGVTGDRRHVVSVLAQEHRDHRREHLVEQQRLCPGCAAHASSACRRSHSSAARSEAACASSIHASISSEKAA